MLAGVGFTVALLIAELAFPGQMERQERARRRCWSASVLAAVLAAVSLRRADGVAGGDRLRRGTVLTPGSTGAR